MTRKKKEWIKWGICLMVMAVMLIGIDIKTFASQQLPVPTEGTTDTQEPSASTEETDGTEELAEVLTLGKVNLKNAESIGYNSVQLTWDLVEQAEGYAIFRALGSSGEWKEIADVKAGIASYEDKGLATGTSYRYKVQAFYMSEGNRVYAEASNILKAKPVPATVELNAEAESYAKIKLTWKKISGANGYGIYRKESGASSFKKIATIKKGKTVSYTDKTVKPGTKYIYKVRAYRTVGTKNVWGNYSQEKKITPTIKAPIVSVGKVACSSIELKWKPVQDANGYKIYRADSKNGTYKAIKTIKSADTLSYTDKTTKAGQTYFYKIKAYRTISGKNISSEQSNVVEQQAVPEAPVLEAKAAGATAVKLTWNAVDLPEKNSGYYIYQTDENGTAKKIKTCKNTKKAYTVKNLTAGVSYRFKIAAYVKDSKGKIAVGAESKVLEINTELLPIQIKSAAADTSGGICLSWDATKNQEEDSYLIYRSTLKKTAYKQIGIVNKKDGTASYEYTDKNVVVGTVYYYRIVCQKAISDGSTMQSANSNTKSVTAAPAQAELKIETADNNGLKLTWTRLKGAASNGYVDGYVIYRSTSENGKYKSIKKINNGKTKTYTDKNLDIGSSYYYKVRGYSKVKNKIVYGAYSPVAVGKVLPGQPTIQVAAFNYNTAQITWTEVKGCDGYTIYRSSAIDGKYKAVKNAAAGTTSYKNTKLETGSTYYYKVRAYCKQGKKKVYGAYSEIKAVTPVLNQPTGLKAEPEGDNEIKLTWNSVAGAETYTILRSTSENGTYKIASEICTVNSFTDSTVVAGSTYYYKVYAVRGNMQSEVSESVSAIATKITFSVEGAIVKRGDHVKITVSANPSGTVVWGTGDSSIAVVTSDGVVYGMKAGTTTVSATVNGTQKKIFVTVKEKLDGKGIDVSAQNGKVDFDAVKASGYEYVMIRITEGKTKDKYFETNYKNAKAAGLKIGVYCYAQARTKATAQGEAQAVLTALNGRAVDYPVVYKMEEETLLYGLTNAERNDILEAFRTKLISSGKGYKFALGTTMRWLQNYLDTERLSGRYLWVSNYRAENLGHGYTGKGSVMMWQYTETGKVAGVNGDVNISICYLQQ